MSLLWPYLMLIFCSAVCRSPRWAELLKVIRDSQNDELTTVMQRLVCAYVEEVMPLAVQLTSHLADTFSMVIDADVQGAEEKAITALGILNTMETVLSVMEERKEVCHWSQ